MSFKVFHDHMNPITCTRPLQVSGKFKQTFSKEISTESLFDHITKLPLQLEHKRSTPDPKHFSDFVILLRNKSIVLPKIPIYS